MCAYIYYVGRYIAEQIYTHLFAPLDTVAEKKETLLFFLVTQFAKAERYKY